jgi:hypothetical protein
MKLENYLQKQRWQLIKAALTNIFTALGCAKHQQYL